MYQPKTFCVEFSAPSALFTRPESRASGEKDSYPVPTYEALVGMIESVYWKPSIVIVVDECRVLDIIQYTMRAKKHVDPASKTWSRAIMAYRMLGPVRYEVKFHLEPNLARPDMLADGQNQKKHEDMMARYIRYGGRRPIYFGSAMSETYGYVKDIEGREPVPGAYDNVVQYDLGIMFFGFRYPDRQSASVAPPICPGAVESYYWRPVMDHGIIQFPPPKNVAEMSNIFCGCREASVVSR